eukprot:INCI18802.1.p1 GENE.INCI18802.1~~INCI18802.1.p1  ORF type:complete len:751 (+),score=216.62 INCI18802.1:152-2254(+)
MDEADLLSELSAIAQEKEKEEAAAAPASGASKPAKRTTTRAEEVLAALVRDYLSAHRLSVVEEIFNAERPISRHAVSDPKKLAEMLRLEKLVSRNKKEANYPSIAEVLAHYYFSCNIAGSSTSQRKKDKKKHSKKHHKKTKKAKDSSVVEGEEAAQQQEGEDSSLDSDEAAELAKEAALAAAIKPDAEFDDVSDQKVQLISSNIGRYTVGDKFSGGPTGDIHGRIVNRLADDGGQVGPGKITVALTEARKTFALQSSNVAKYAPGMPFDNGAVAGFVLACKGSTNDGKNGPGQVIIALKPTVNTDKEITYVRRKKLRKKPGDIAGRDFEVQDVREARILLMDHMNDVLISDVQSADILVGPTAGCVRLKDCSKCNVVVACREIKIAKCDNIRVFLSCATPPIVGWGSKAVFIGPFTAAYPHLAEQFAAAELNPAHNCWQQTVDRDAEKKAKSRRRSKSKAADQGPPFVLMDAQRTFDEEGSKFHIRFDDEPDAEVTNPVPPDAVCIAEEAEREKSRAQAIVEAAEAKKKAEEEAEATAKRKAEEEAEAKRLAEEEAAAAKKLAEAEAAANAVPEVMTLSGTPLKGVDLESLKASPLGGLKPKAAKKAAPSDDIKALIAAQKKAAKGEVEEEELHFDTDEEDDSHDSMELNMNFRDSVDEQRLEAVKAKQQADFVRRNAEDEKRFAELKKLKENSVLNGAI